MGGFSGIATPVLEHGQGSRRRAGIATGALRRPKSRRFGGRAPHLSTRVANRENRRLVQRAQAESTIGAGSERPTAACNAHSRPASQGVTIGRAGWIAILGGRAMKVLITVMAAVALSTPFVPSARAATMPTISEFTMSTHRVTVTGLQRQRG